MLWLRNGITNLDRGSRPGSKALDVAARLDVRTDLDRGSRPGGRALERSPGARRGSAARRADLDGGSRPGGRRSTLARRSTRQRGSTCGPTWTAAPGLVVGRSTLARRSTWQRGSTCGPTWTALPARWYVATMHTPSAVGAVALVPGVVVASPWRRVGVKGERHMVRVGMWDAGCSHVAKQLKT